MDSLNPGRGDLQSYLKDASIKIGGKGTNKKLLCITEQADKYTMPIQPNASTTMQNKELAKYLKGHHFDFANKEAKSASNKMIKPESPYGFA